MREDFFAMLLDRWAHEDHDAYVDSVCPVDGVLTTTEKVNATKAAKDMDLPNAEWNAMLGVLKPIVDRSHTKQISICNAIKEERIGTPIGRFEEFYTGESEDHLESVIEALGVMPHMSYRDAVNEVNVY